MARADGAVHATQKRFVYSHTWTAGDLVVWDNRCTMHRGRPYEDQLSLLRGFGQASGNYDAIGHYIHGIADFGNPAMVSTLRRW